MNLRQMLFGGIAIPGWATNAGLFVLRVTSGLGLALGHGLGKVPPSERFIAGVVEMGFPAPALFAWAAGLSELAGGLLLALGLATRPSSFFVLCTMLVALLIRHAADPFGNKEKALLYAAIALLFLLLGAGKYSVDALVNRRK